MAKKILKKELIKKEDGRYLYLYTWAEEEKSKIKRQKAAGLERNRHESNPS